MKQAMYPVETCIQPHQSQWIEYLSYDRAYLHSALCATQSFLDFVREKRFSEKALYHLNRCLQTLRQNLANSKMAMSDSTISTVMTLAALSDAVNDTVAAKSHMQGLYKLVNLRGGILNFHHNIELQSKALRWVTAIHLNPTPANLLSEPI